AELLTISGNGVVTNGPNAVSVGPPPVFVSVGDPFFFTVQLFGTSNYAFGSTFTWSYPGFTETTGLQDVGLVRTPTADAVDFNGFNRPNFPFGGTGFSLYFPGGTFVGNTVPDVLSNLDFSTATAGYWDDEEEFGANGGIVRGVVDVGTIQAV